MSGVEGENGSRPARLALILNRFRVERLDDPAWLEGLQDAALAFLGRLSIQQKFLRQVRPSSPASGPVEWIDAKGVAALMHRSESTIRHLPPDAIPGRRQQAKGCKVLWNKQIVMNWLAECSSG